MAIALNIKHDMDRLNRVLRGHEKILMKKAVPQAINRTIKTVRSTAVKEIASITGHKQKIVRAQIKIIKANKKSLTGALDARTGKAENLIEFVKPAQRTPQFFRKRTRKGYKFAGVKAKAWGKTKVYNGTFIGGSGTGGPKVYKRTGASRKGIERVLGPSIRREFIEDSLTATMTRIGAKRFHVELDAAINNQIRRQR